MKSQEEAFRLLENALKQASHGGEEVEVAIGGGCLDMTRFANNEVLPSFSRALDWFSVRVVVDGRSSRVVTNDLTQDGMARASEFAKERLGELSSTDFPGGLAVAQSYHPVDGWDASLENANEVDRIGMVSSALLGAHKAGLSAYGHLALRRGGTELDGFEQPYAIASTKGLLAYHAASRVSFSVTMQSETGTGRADTESCLLDGIDIQGAVEHAVQRASIAQAEKSLSTGVYPVVLSPAALASMIKHLARISGAKEMNEKGSHLTGQVGELKTGERITIRDDYLHPLHRGFSFDADGVARTNLALIEEGVLKGPLVSWLSAKRFEMEPTGHGEIGGGEAARYLVMEGTREDPEALLSQLGTGLLLADVEVCTLSERRKLTVSGATAELYAVRDGQLTKRMKNMRFSISLLDLLSRVQNLSRESFARGCVVPSVLVDGFPLYA